MSLYEWKCFLVIAILCIWTGEPTIHRPPLALGLENCTAFLTKVCSLLLESSEHKLLHVMTGTPELDTTDLIRNLHDILIPTLQANNIRATSPQFADTKPKTMLFLLDDLNSITNLILGSQNFGKVVAPATLHESAENIIQFSDVEHQRNNLPNFCIHYGEELKYTLADSTRSCDVNLTISDMHLQDHSILSDDLFDQVRGLYMNNVWNSRSYLIFHVVKSHRFQQFLERSSSQEGDQIHAIRFLFKFIWRMFKGQRTLICFAETCYRYDPFFEELRKYEEGNKRQFFDFSWYSMNGKTLTYSVLDVPLFSLDANVFDICADNCLGPIIAAVLNLASIRNSSFAVYQQVNSPYSRNISSDSITGFKSLEDGLKYGVDVIVFQSGYSNFANLQDYDISPTIETCRLTIRLPRKGYVPQYVAPFYCFSPTLWIVLIMTIFIFTATHYMLIYAHCEMFQSSNIEAIRSNELFPTGMTIYRYILGIGQPRLILIEFMTGKIVFFVVVFSMMIFITLFQSGMFSLLSSMVRYEDIDTLREIEESDLMVQSNNIESEMQFLGDDLEFDWIKMRLTDSYEFKCPRVSCFLNPIGDGPYVAKVTANSNTTIQSKGEIDKILKSHAFLIRMTTLHTELRDLLYFNPATENKYEFHIVRERLMSYPLMYLMIRNAFYNEALNDMLFRVFESGTDNTLYEDYTTGGDFQRFEESENNQARPFTLTDFRLAFVSLVLGWVLSGFCFALELLWRF